MGLGQVEPEGDVVANLDLVAGGDLGDQVLVQELGVDVVLVADQLGQDDAEILHGREGRIGGSRTLHEDILRTDTEDDAVAALAANGVVEVLALDVVDQAGHDVLIEGEADLEAVLEQQVVDLLQGGLGQAVHLGTGLLQDGGVVHALVGALAFGVLLDAGEDLLVELALGQGLCSCPRRR